MVGLELPKRVFPCASPADVRSTLPEGKDVLAFQVRPCLVRRTVLTGQALSKLDPTHQARAASLISAHDPA